jgi:hypothetical protein
MPAVGTLLPDSEIGGAERLLKWMYRADLLVIAPLMFIQSARHLGRPARRASDRVDHAIALTAPVTTRLPTS